MCIDDDDDDDSENDDDDSGAFVTFTIGLTVGTYAFAS